MYRRQSQRGIALITTLIMLSVVTVMAVAFLAVSRRERSAVTSSSDRLDAKSIAEAAFERAKSEVISRVLNVTNLLSYDLLVSTNYINPLGFVPSNTNIANVSYVYANGALVTGDDQLELYRNLQINPRAPVFITTNAAKNEQDFRYFLDFNRNGLFETNGFQPEIDIDGKLLGSTNFYVGDPEWIGVLRRPDYPHSGTNHFIGRFAYLVLPAGKALDLNFVHNQAKLLGPELDGYFRNQGVGPWELNLAGFLRDLNTNSWNTYDYLTNFNPSPGIAFVDARLLSSLKYRESYNNLESVSTKFGLPGSRAFVNDYVDGYGDGPLQLDTWLPYTTGAGNVRVALDNDVTTKPWFGADSLSQFFDPQELFVVRGRNEIGTNSFSGRLFNIGRSVGTYNKHTFYRLLAGLGTDSVPLNRSQINLNYDNRLDFDPRLAGVLTNANRGFHATNFVRWSPIAFFTNAADQILKIQHPAPGNGVPLLAVTNIQVWPTNDYSPAVHRSLQLAANIYDATTNSPLVGYPYLPTVYRPLITTNGAQNVFITGYRDATSDPWENIFAGTSGSARLRPGIPLIIGARKGFPNFNEFELQTTVVAGRKLELVKRSQLSAPAFTNQLYTLAISNVIGVEFWNSYEQPYPRPLQLRARVNYELVLSNQVGRIRTLTGFVDYTTNFTALQWRERQFQIPIQTNLQFLPNSVYRVTTGQVLPFRTNFLNTLFESANGFPLPVWRLSVSNRLEAALIDTSVVGGRLVDYVNLHNLNTLIDITGSLPGERNNAGQNTGDGSYWKTNRVNGGIPEGIMNQLMVSMGAIQPKDWNSFPGSEVADKEKSIERFREFVGLSGTPAPPSPTLRMQVPFSPGIKLYVHKSWQVNDPLVNDLIWDLTDPIRGTNDIQRLPPLFPPEYRSNLGLINRRYSPWGRSQNESSATTAMASDPSVKDPQVTKSDDWIFPTNTLPNIGWLGRIHRGTPWQTVYLKSFAAPLAQWTNWSGHTVWQWPSGVISPGTNPTNDWKILDLFTTAVTENGSRGLLSVNQDGIAAWSAVLSGVPVLTNVIGSTNIGSTLIEPNSFELKAIVDGINATRVRVQGQRFNYLGEILATPELSLGSPFLRRAGPSLAPSDAVYERIPQMVLSLLKHDEPRFVVYAFGQSLRPAPGSVVTEPGPFFQMPTNYVVTGEYVTKSRVRLEGYYENNRLRVRPITESYNEVPPTE